MTDKKRTSLLERFCEARETLTRELKQRQTDFEEADTPLQKQVNFNKLQMTKDALKGQDDLTRKIKAATIHKPKI
ncbi:MAG: hypothetical protein U9N14_07925 [Pseudomonadota bacterium]|nr:hypothetical protein [Pseudomonadota bacterium]